MDKAPVHLKPHSAAWFDGVMSVFELAPHHVHLLTLACDALDRGAQAREALSANGITYIDARGFPKARPEVAIERDARVAFARLLRELDLDWDPFVDPSRPPALHSNRRSA
jgi:phage terminase small subunit